MADTTQTETSKPATGGTTTADTIASGAAPLIEKAKAFAKAKPAATAALAGVLGIALINTLRGRR